MENLNLVVSSSPHIHTNETVRSTMLDVIIALVPACLASIVFFGMQSLAIILTAVAACMISEWAFQKITRQPVTVNDLSAAVTGILLGLNMPSTIPLWMLVIGSVFSIVVVKQLYGGLGKNFLNPAMAGRCFMIIAWAGAMTTWGGNVFVDATSSATPLAVMKGGTEGTLPSLFDAFIGIEHGSIGEVSALCLIIGFVYLVIKRVVSIRIPAMYIISFALLTYLFGINTTGKSDLEYTLLQILTGGFLLGAFFMATDYVTTPTTLKGQYIFALGCGILTFVIRRFGGYPEGTSFSILLMNVASPLIETLTIPKPFGAKGGKKE